MNTMKYQLVEPTTAMQAPFAFQLGARGNTSVRHRMRCSTCGCRFTLKRHPSKYKRQIKCPNGHTSTYSCEAARRRELAKQVRCYCNGVPFPHRAGSILGCDSHPVHPDDWTKDQERQYEGMMRTPRGG